MKQFATKLQAQTYAANNADKALTRAVRALGWKPSEIHLKTHKEIKSLEKRLWLEFSKLEMPSLDFQSAITKKSVRIAGNYTGMVSSIIRHYINTQWVPIGEEGFRKLLRKRTNKVYKEDQFGYPEEISKDIAKETVFEDSCRSVGIGSGARDIRRIVEAKADKAGNILIVESVLVYD